jgi:hypothetical protein
VRVRDNNEGYISKKDAATSWTRARSWTPVTVGPGTNKKHLPQHGCQQQKSMDKGKSMDTRNIKANNK